ncbi:hypothetical protein EMPS_04401 [Entomortierella parvispora]|uniref:Uncharacterized protein n=1 Tax=Entomortierella parvispora TaxID=205924 RepID=A0A9P3H8G2_9FUNG|nr:hypothetical protein EMPS_04401 [Entomortierella parvispora]
MSIGVDTTDRSAVPVDIFDKATNPGSAASSVLVYKASLLDFGPSAQPVKNLGDNFRYFQNDLPHFSGFHYEYELIVSPTFDGPFSQFEEVIGDLNPYGRHHELVVCSLHDLLPDHIDDNEDNNWLLSPILTGQQSVHETVFAGYVVVTVSLKNAKDEDR